MPKVRKDAHGLCLKVGGYVWRPIFPVGYRHAYKDESQLEAGQTVTARHSGGPLLTIKHGDSIKEVWFSHGAYLGPDQSPKTVHYFKPAHELW